MSPDPKDPRVRRGEICVECGAPFGGAVGHTRLCPRCRDPGPFNRPRVRPRPPTRNRRPVPAGME
jgi:hypothetical protein